MNTKMQVTNADDIEMELTVNMTLGQWKRLKDQFSTFQYPAGDLGSEISSMVAQAEKQFCPKSEGE